MNELKDLLKDCIDLVNEIYEIAFSEELYSVRNKSSILIENLKKLFQALIESGLSIDPMIIQKAEKLVETINVGDCITTMDIVKFEMKPILIEYLESMGETHE